MSKYIILKIGNVYTINRVSKESWGIEYIPSRPVRYYKTKRGAELAAKKRGLSLVK